MKLEYPKEWFERSAELEGDAEVGAGLLPADLPRGVKTNFPETRIALGQFVDLWRRKQGWNAEKLAAEAGIDTAEVLEIEHDPHYQPEPNAVIKLAGVFGVPSRRLMELAGLVQSATPRLREETVRFSPRSELPAKLSETEHQLLEAFVATLTSKSE